MELEAPVVDIWGLPWGRDRRLSGENRATIVIPAYREGRAIEPVLARIAEAVMLPFEALVVVDDAGDPTVATVEEVSRVDPRFRVVLNGYGRGPANAIRFGADRADTR